MAKDIKVRQKMAFYKNKRKINPYASNAQLKAMWESKLAKDAAAVVAAKEVEQAKKIEEEMELAAELTAKKAIEDAKISAEEAKKDEVPDPVVIWGAAIAETLAPSVQ